MSGVAMLKARFAAAGDTPAVIEPAGSVTSYAALLAQIETLSTRFAEAGVGPGTSVQLIGDFGAADIAWMIALWNCGAIVGPVAPTSVEMAERFAEVGDAAFIARPSDDALETGPGTSACPLFRELRGKPGLVIFSSGTTGMPKGAVHDIDRLMSKFDTAGKAMPTVGFLLFDHVSGIDTALYTLTAGGALICLSARDPATVCAVIEAEKAEVLPTAPSFLNMLLMSGAADDHDLSSLRIITYGGEMMPQGVLDRVAAAFPWVRVIQKYGASEIGALKSRSFGTTSRWIEFASDGTNWRVVDGLLEIRTRTAMIGYLNAPSPFTEDGWYRTGDRVEVDGSRIRFVGRDNDLISVGGQKVYPAEVEAALREVDGVLDAVVFGKPHPILGASVFARLQVPAGTIEPAALRVHVRQALTGKLEPYKIPQRMEFTEEGLQNARFKNVRR